MKLYFVKPFNEIGNGTNVVRLGHFSSKLKRLKDQFQSELRAQKNDFIEIATPSGGEIGSSTTISYNFLIT